MRNHNTFTNDVIEFTILEDFTREKSMGKKMMEVEPGRTELVKTFKEIKIKNIRSKITVYTCDVRMVRDIPNNKLKPFKDRALIKMANNDIFIVAETKKNVEERLFKNFKNNKIGF